jgi:membrane protein DedA with SNARE-associated domain
MKNYAFLQSILPFLDKYTEWLEHLVFMHSALAPLLLLMLEEAGIPIFVPGDIVIAYTGYKISRSHISLWFALAVATAAVLIGSSILFYIARKWGKVVINKIGRFIFLKEEHIKRAEKMFRKYGVWGIIFGRHIPGMRIPITIFAATSGVSYLTFIISTFISVWAWVLFYLYIGKTYGHHVRQDFHHYMNITLIIVALIIAILFILHFIGKKKQSRKRTLTQSK